MNSSWPSVNGAPTPSLVHESTCCPGVSVRVKKMTLGGRIELLERIYPLLKEAESMATGASESDQVRNQLCTLKVHEALLRWGVLEVSGLTADGAEVTASSLPDAAPEELIHEVLQVIQRQVTLPVSERKN